MFENLLVTQVIPKKNLLLWITAIWVFFIFASIFILLLGILKGFVLPLVLEISKTIQQYSNLTIPMVLVSIFGEFYITASLFLTFLGFLYIKNYRNEALFLPAVLFSPILNLLLKEVVARPRPSPAVLNVFGSLPTYSFPSGHVMSYVVFF